MSKFLNNPLYLALVFFIVMPLNGMIILQNGILGFVLIAMHIPYFIIYVYNKVKITNKYQLKE